VSGGVGGAVLVAGGAGFIGSHLCEALLARGRRVVCLDNLQTGSAANVAHLLGAHGPAGRFRLVEHDVTRPLPADLGPFGEVYNLACPASPQRYQRDPVHTMLTSVLGAHHLLERARDWGAAILQASTSEVYGDPDVHPQPESYRGSVNPVGPRACYDEGKRAAEALFFDYARTRGVRVRVARIFNTYGPRMAEDDGRIVSNLVSQALRGRPLTVYGDGRQTRSLCHVDDMVRGLLALMERGGGAGGPVNLGNPEEVSVLELARRVLAATGSASPVRFLPLPEDDPRRRRPDIARAEALLGWRPRVPLEEGLRRTVEDFKHRLSPPPGGRPSPPAQAPARPAPAGGTPRRAARCGGVAAATTTGAAR
jgi:UDP-glucuronate decarboxylase